MPSHPKNPSLPVKEISDVFSEALIHDDQTSVDPEAVQALRQQGFTDEQIRVFLGLKPDMPF